MRIFRVMVVMVFDFFRPLSCQVKFVVCLQFYARLRLYHVKAVGGFVRFFLYFMERVEGGNVRGAFNGSMFFRRFVLEGFGSLFRFV